MSKNQQAQAKPDNESDARATKDDPPALLHQVAAVADSGAIAVEGAEGATEGGAQEPAAHPKAPDEPGGSIHVEDSTATPLPDAPYGFKADGTPRKSNQGRRASESVSDERDKQRARLRSVTPSTAKMQVKAPSANVTALAVVNYQAMGESVASMWFAGGTMLLGDEWEPDKSEGEHLAVAGAFRDYFKSTNMRDLPPGFALCFILGVYTMKRVSKPKTSGKLKLFGAWVRSKFPKRNRMSLANPTEVK